MENKLNFAEVLSEAFTIGLKNFFSILGCVILWLVTIWIPYLNVGTTIAISTLPAALSKGKVISPLEIFNSRYLKFMGEFFLVQGLLFMILLPALIFLIVPAIVLSLAYCLSALLVVDKGKGASEALKLSNMATSGSKWIIFFVQIVLVIPLGIVGLIWEPLAIIYAIIFIPVMMGAAASIYGKLTAGIPDETQPE